MCLIVFAWQHVPGKSLVAAANRDEFYDRPAAPAARWKDHPQVFAGRDLLGGGTWLGVTDEGRFAALTNIRAPSERRPDAPTRGMLVSDFLTGSLSPNDYISRIAGDAHRYNGFNLLVGTRDELVLYSKRRSEAEDRIQQMKPGLYGLSNGCLDSSWPKVDVSKVRFARLLSENAPDSAYFDMLADSSPAPVESLPDTGVGLERELMLSAICIKSPDYGTRVSSLVEIGRENGARLSERLIV